MTKEDFLIKLYEKSGLDINYRFGREEVINEFNIDEEVFDRYSNYWVDKGFLHGPTQTTIGNHLVLFFKSSGIDYVEELIEERQDQSEIIENMNDEFIKIFISHSKLDEDLAKALVKLLIGSLKIEKEEIRCTSVPGYKFDPGINTNEAIRKEVNESALLIGLLTPHSLTSTFVLFELGARWGLQKPLIPLLANESDFKDLPTPIQHTNAVKIEKEEDLFDLIEAISKKLEISTEKISSYGDEIKLVLEQSVKKKINSEDSSQIVEKKETELSFQEAIKKDAFEIEIQREIDGILQSEKGVEIAKEEGEKFFKALEQTCEEAKYPESGIVFNVKRKHLSVLKWEAELKGNGGSAYIEFYIPATNRVRSGVEHADDAHIRIFASNHNQFDDYRGQLKSKKTYEKLYYLTLNRAKEPVWSEQKRDERGVSTQAILNKIFLEFYEFTKRYRDSL